MNVITKATKKIAVNLLHYFFFVYSVFFIILMIQIYIQMLENLLSSGLLWIGIRIKGSLLLKIELK